MTNEQISREVDNAGLAPEARLERLWRTAGDFQIELEGFAQREPAMPLTAEQVTTFNHLLRDAREVLPKSIALREDVEDMETGEMEATAAGGAYFLRVTIVPALHNALPENLQGR